MKIEMSILLVLILTFLASKLKINIKCLDKCKNVSKVEFNINLGLYLFGFIKIFGLSFKTGRMQFLFFHFSYPKVKMEKESIKILKEFSWSDFFKNLNIKLEQFYFDLKIGTEDMMFTVFSVFFISTFLSIFSGKYAKHINLKHYTYKVSPIYNTNYLEFKTSARISIKILDVIKTLIYLKKSTKQKKAYRFHIKQTPIKI